MKHKKLYGQFYTTNYEYILQDLRIPSDALHIVEPFVGNGDLLNFIQNKENITIECYDIEPQNDQTVYRDTLLNPPLLKNKFVLTNPPFLARNKCTNKKLFDKYNFNDLYKCFIHTLIEDPPNGGILILPLNFWCSIRKQDVYLRYLFLQQFYITRLNIFETKTFFDTSTTICSFQFETHRSGRIQTCIPIKMFPDNIEMKLLMNKQNNYTFGGEIYQLPQTASYKVGRYVNTMNQNNPFVTCILLKCIDGPISNSLGLFLQALEWNNKDYILPTSRSYAVLTIEPIICYSKQELLVSRFNEYISNVRQQYHSLCLPTYREFSRKRISFQLCYQIVNYILKHLEVESAIR